MKEGWDMDKAKKAMASWKPYAYALATLATLLVAAGARWKP
jgi:hypothetical protein